MHLARNTVYEKINSKYETTRFLHQDIIYIYYILKRLQMEPVLIEHLKYHLNDIICRDIDVFYKEGEYTYSMCFMNIFIY